MVIRGLTSLTSSGCCIDSRVLALTHCLNYSSVPLSSFHTGLTHPMSMTHPPHTPGLNNIDTNFHNIIHTPQLISRYSLNLPVSRHLSCGSGCISEIHAKVYSLYYKIPQQLRVSFNSLYKQSLQADLSQACSKKQLSTVISSLFN